MIKKFIDYEKRDFDLKKIYKVFKKVSNDIDYILIKNEIDRNEYEETIINSVDEMMSLKDKGNIDKIIMSTNDQTSILIINSFYDITSICISAERKESILRVKEILEGELELKEILDKVK